MLSPGLSLRRRQGSGCDENRDATLVPRPALAYAEWRGRLCRQPQLGECLGRRPGFVAFSREHEHTASEEEPEGVVAHALALRLVAGCRLVRQVEITEHVRHAS